MTCMLNRPPWPCNAGRHVDVGSPDGAPDRPNDGVHPSRPPSNPNGPASDPPAGVVHAAGDGPPTGARPGIDSANRNVHTPRPYAATNSRFTSLGASCIDEIGTFGIPT